MEKKRIRIIVEQRIGERVVIKLSMMINLTVDLETIRVIERSLDSMRTTTIRVQLTNLSLI
jgi:hypothetical protein